MNSDVPLGLEHRFIAGDGAGGGLTLLLLHGTGGDGDSLLQLGYTLAPGAALLSPTGNVKEGELRRFFRRFPDGSFDQDDLTFRTSELTQFVRDATDAYQLDPQRVVAVGFSNGANAAASIVLREPYMLAGAVLLRAQMPFPLAEPAKLHRMPVLLCLGGRDTVTPSGQGERLAEALRDGNANLTLHVEDNGGHELALGDLHAAQRWMRSYFGGMLAAP